MAGLRLPQAKAKMQEVTRTLLNASFSLNTDLPFFDEAVAALRFASGQFRQRFAFLSELPYLLATCRTQEGLGTSACCLNDGHPNRSLLCRTGSQLQCTCDGLM